MAKRRRKRKITEEQVSDMIKRCQRGESKKSIARIYGVHETTVISYVSYGSQYAHTEATARRRGFNSASEYLSHQRTERRMALSEISVFLIRYHNLK